MEARVHHESNDEQAHLVREYCKEAEALIALARSRDDAARIKDGQCQRFSRECKSKLIVNAAAKYLDQLIERKWG